MDYSARVHRGRHRKSNEDNIFVDGVFCSVETRDRPFFIDGSSREATVFAVCDGLGGERMGDVASLTAVRKLSEVYQELKMLNEVEMANFMQKFSLEVADEIHRRTDGGNQRIGTTLATAVATERGLYCFNVGDSRVYCFQAGKLIRVTDDHTLAFERVKQGMISAEYARFEKGGHKVTRCIGIGERNIVQAYEPINGNCRIVLCSDGLTDMVSDERIESVLKKARKTKEVADELLNHALERGGRDNIAIVVANITISASWKDRILKKVGNWMKRRSFL